MADLKLRLGQVVVVKDAGRVYSGYRQMAEDMRLTNWKGDLRDSTGEFVVVGTALHGSAHIKEILVAIENSKGEQFLISQSGLEDLHTVALRKELHAKIDRLQGELEAAKQELIDIA